MDYKLTNKTIDKLKYDLVREGLLDYNKLIESIDTAKNNQISLSEVLIRDKIISEEDLLNFLEKKLHIPYVNLEDYSIDGTVVGLISEKQARKYNIIPLFKIEDTLTVAMSDPLDLFALNNIFAEADFNVEPVICSERNIIRVIDTYYNPQEKGRTKTAVDKHIETSTSKAFDWRSELGEEQDSEANIYRVVRAIIFQAINENASEIHFIPAKDDLILNFRIDGKVFDRGSIPILMAQGCLAKLKSAAGLDIEEHSLLQNGKMEINIDKSYVNAGVIIMPTTFGERAVVKLYKKTPLFESLGFEFSQYETFNRHLNRNGSLILATGAFTSGQSTTMYAILELLSSKSNNILTIEKDIRYCIDNISQISLSMISNNSINDVLENSFYHNPDILYLYEIFPSTELDRIRKLSFSGSTILSYIFASEPIEAVYKLLEMGFSPLELQNYVGLIFSQKLLRTLCFRCKEESNPPLELIDKYKLPPDIKYYKHKGCTDCNNTGYKDQTAAFELLELNHQIISKFLSTQDRSIIREHLEVLQHKTLFDAALVKIKRGLTDFDEVFSVFNSY